MRSRATSIALLTVVWLLLWHDLTPWLVVGGVLTAVLVTAAFPFPKAPWVATFRPWPALVLLAVFTVDVVRASAEVTWIAIRPAPVPASAVVRVDLRTDSELLMAVTGELVSLVPGSLLIELAPDTSSLYLHVLDGSTPERIERAIARVRSQEERVVRAFAPRAERIAICGEDS